MPILSSEVKLQYATKRVDILYAESLQTTLKLLLVVGARKLSTLLRSFQLPKSIRNFAKSFALDEKQRKHGYFSFKTYIWVCKYAFRSTGRHCNYLYWIFVPEYFKKRPSMKPLQMFFGTSSFILSLLWEIKLRCNRFYLNWQWIPGFHQTLHRNPSFEVFLTWNNESDFYGPMPDTWMTQFMLYLKRIIHNIGWNGICQNVLPATSEKVENFGRNGIAKKTQWMHSFHSQFASSVYFLKKVLV